MPKTAQKSYTETIAYNLAYHGITQGFISTFLSCREQARLRYLEGWTPYHVSSAIRFGLVFHELLNLSAQAKFKVPAVLRLIRKQKVHSQTDPQELETILALNEVLFHAYQEKWSENDAERRWIAKERTFTVPHHWQPEVQEELNAHVAALESYNERSIVKLVNGEVSAIPIRGRIDGLFEDAKGQLWVHEIKTKGQIDEDGLMQALHLNLQTMLYAWAASKLERRPVAGVLYDVVRRPQLRQGNTESLDAYVKRVKGDVASRPDHYFMRWPVQFGKQDIKAWETTSLNRYLFAIEQWWSNLQAVEHPKDALSHYMNPNAMMTAWGKCDLFNRLTLQDSSGTFQLPHATNTKKPTLYEPFPELEG